LCFELKIGWLLHSNLKFRLVNLFWIEWVELCAKLLNVKFVIYLVIEMQSLEWIYECDISG